MREKTSTNKIKVLVIDDSALIRHVLTEILNQAGDIEVVATAQDPIFAMNKINNLKPDVITLDVEMPRMDGLTFLGKLMKTNPLPVLMISSLTQKGYDTALKALELGAVDYVPKPAIDISNGVFNLGDEIIKKVRIAYKARVRHKHRFLHKVEDYPTDANKPPASKLLSTTDKIIAIGASTGGTQAITEIISALPEDSPGIVIVQHMPPKFTRSFADRLNSMSKLDVKEAQTGDRVLKGNVLIAPGDQHMILNRDGAMYYIGITDGPAINFVKPSVDVLFSSVAEHAGKNAMGIILTGMGEDGARGLLEMKTAGAFTIAQDEASSVVFGMPKKAIELGAADRIASLDVIAAILAGGLKAG